MKTASQIEKEFLEKFDALLIEYAAYLECRDEYEGYPECGEDIHARVIINARYDERGERISDFADIDLGSFRSPEPNTDAGRE